MQPFAPNTLVVSLLNIICLVGFMIGLSSCIKRPDKGKEAQEFSQFSGNGIDTVRRIVIMPIYRDSRVSEKALVFQDKLIRSLAELNRFEVLTATIAERDELYADDPLRANRLSETSLRKTREMFGADAVVIGRINHWNSYDPVAIGATLSMVDCRDGKAVWSASGMWDAASRSIQDDLKAWHYDRRGYTNEVVGGWRIALSSPSYFSRYVSDRLAASVLSQKDDHH